MQASLSRRSRNVANDTTKKQTQGLLKQLKGALQAPHVLARKRATLLTLVTQILQNVSASQRLTKQDLVQIEQCARQTFDIIVTLQEPRSTGQSYLPAFIVQFFNARSFIGQLDSLQQDLTLTLQNVCSINENEVDSKSTSTQDEDPASSSTTHILDKDNLADLQDDLAILPAALQAIQFDLQLLHTEAQNLQRLTAPLQSRAEDFHLCWTSSSEDGELLRTSFKGLAMQLAVQLLIKNATIREVDLTYEPTGLARVEPQGIFGTPAAAVWKKKHVLSKHVSVARMQLQEITQLDRATQTWQNINHRNLVRLYGVRALESQVELIVEPCDFSLKEFLSDRDRELSLIEEETIMKGVARGLAHLHSHNILHQNLCPETVMCAKHLRSNIKLTDFGLCKHESSSMLAYTAPEIMGESPHWTQYADVYAFAMLCYEIKERQEPWVNEYPGTIIEEVQEGVRPSIGDDTAWKSRLLKIVTKAWSARIEERPSMAEIQRELEERIRDRRSTRVLQQMFGLGTTEQPSHEYGQGHLAERASAPKVLEAGERLPSPHKSHTDILDASEDDCDYSTSRKKYMKLREEARKKKRKNPRAIMALLKDNNLEEHYNAIVEKAKITTIKKGQKMTAHDLEKAGIRTMSQRTNILFAFKRADPKMYSGSAGGGSSDSSSGSSSSSSDSDSSTREKNYSKDSGSDIGLDPAIEEEALKKIFDDNEVGDMFEAAKKAGFTMQLGKNCSHIELKVANISMMKRFAIIKACQAYERPSRDTPDEVSAGGDSEVNEILKRNGLDARLNDSEEKVLKKIFHDNEVGDMFEAAKKAGFTMQLGKNCSHIELKVANISMMKRFAIIKACQAYERLSEDTLDEVNAGGDSEEIKRILEKNHLEKYTKTLFNSGYTTIRKCKNLSHGELRAIGINLFSDRDKVVQCLRNLDEGKSLSRRSSRSGSEGSDEESVIKKVLKECNGNDAIRKDLIKKGFNSVKKCVEMSHSDLKQAGMWSYADRERVLNAFKEAEGKMKTSRSHSESKHRSRSGSRGGSSSSSCSSSDSGSGGDDEKRIKKTLQKLEVDDKVRKYLRKKGFTTIKKCKAMQHSDLREAGMIMYTQREKVINTFAEMKASKSRRRSHSRSRDHSREDDKATIMRILKKEGLDVFRKNLQESDLMSLKKLKEVNHADLRNAGIARFADRDKIKSAFCNVQHQHSSSFSSSDSSPESSGSSPGSSTNEWNEIKKVLEKLGKEKYVQGFRGCGFTSFEKTKDLTHANLRVAGVSLFSDRDEIITAMKDLKTSKNSRIKGHRRGRRRRRSSSSESSEGGNDDEKIIKEALKSVKCYSKLSPLLKQGFTVEKALKGSHNELKAVNIPMSQRFEIIKYIKANAEKKPKSHSRSSSSSGSSSDADDSAAIRKALNIAGADRYYAIISRQYPTLKLCKELNHATLRSLNVNTYIERNQIIGAFQAVSSRSGSRSRSRSSSRSGGGSSSEDEELFNLLTDAGVQRYYKAMCNAGFDTVNKCSKLGHPQLRNIGITMFGDREKILNAVKGAVTPIYEDARPNIRAKFAIGGYVRYKGTNARVHMDEIGQVVNRLPDDKCLVRFGTGRQVREVICKDIDLTVSFVKPKKKKKFLGLF